MPIYEYHCKGCNNDFEAIMWTSDDKASVRCPKCSSKEVERILSAFSRSCKSGSDSLSKSSCSPGPSRGFS